MNKLKSVMNGSGFIVKKDCCFCYSMCFSRRCDLEKLLAEEESKWGTKMKKKWRNRKEETVAAYFSVVRKSINSVLVSAERCI